MKPETPNPETKDRDRAGGDTVPTNRSQSAAADVISQGTVTKELPSLSQSTRPTTTVTSLEKPSRDGTGDADREEDSEYDELGGEGEDEETYPEGGLQAWLVVLGSWLALFGAMGLMSSLATFHAYIGSHQLKDYSHGAIGWIFSVYTFLCFFGGIYIGPVFDKYGPRWLVLSGSVCVVTSLMLLSVSTEYWHFMLSFGILNGIGASLIFTPSIAAVGHYFRDRRGLATGVASTGGSLGGIMFPLAMHELFERIGWAWTIRVVGFICAGCCGVANLLIRSRLPPALDATAHPDMRILREPAFALTTAGVFLFEFGLFIPLTYISSFMVSAGFDAGISYRILPILNASSVMGRIVAGWWGDLFGPYNSNISSVALSIVACLAVWLPFGESSLAAMVVFAVMFGFASGNNISISPVCIGRLCKTQNYGRYYATTYTVVSIACLVGVPIGGEIIGATGGKYWGLIVFTGAMYAASFVALWAAKVVCVGWRVLAIF
ncbi:hypothetical protein ACRALDRAFT_1028240 [Sodiomyces alcalophilus JCM 7366]|uniref:uncharacterized protein n=1 Tax=Sodiomyces alcalophilus JCM 7366 TaxID=591952 RepID=UPI0039B5D248